MLPQQLYRWRRQLAEAASGERSGGGFLPVEVVAGSDGGGEPPARRSSRERVEIVLTNGRLLRVGAGIEAEALGRLIRVAEEA